jgi:hypothetical protein
MDESLLPYIEDLVEGADSSKHENCLKSVCRPYVVCVVVVSPLRGSLFFPLDGGLRPAANIISPLCGWFDRYSNGFVGRKILSQVRHSENRLRGG